MRMRPHIDTFADAKDRGPEMIEEDEWADHARTRRGQRAANLQPAEIDRARHYNMRDHVA